MRAESSSKCFRKARVLDATKNVVSSEDEDDPFLQADASSAFQGLIDKTVGSQEKCLMEEYMNGDSDLAVACSWRELGGKPSCANRTEWARTARGRK